MKNIKKVYPFTAIVGQENMKKALILNVINPSLGGVLIRGEKGTAKSTAVRALAQLLPEREQVEGCIFGCDPEDKGSMCANCREKMKKGQKLNKVKEKMKVVDLPVSATEDRVVGTLDIEYAIKKGEKKFEPGILAQSNRNILYVDEVNLLDDHVVDVLLDSAAMGVNTIEREGVSFSHPAKFILVGTMNPEEGDLRPQLLDRFGMVVDVIGERDTEKRVQVIKRRLEYENDSEAFISSYDKEQQKLRDKISKAKEILKEVTFDDKTLQMAATISIEMDVDGHRADISMIKTAMTIAAFNGRDKVNSKDMIEAAELTLPHRMRRKPFEEGVMDFSKVEEIINEIERG
ncbi:magnesium chelatase subunit I [Clostridium tetanomorphum]|uniref:Mg-protoporphyrin IX chelatase n=1 Tax=Clostridium tetanomorphum TaxID=1553 RepID=A0A923J020_CLOTT|nr:ATP-binding protein [Clostridium tetanomorphum]KAJ52351.1 magnesium chelatase [Clostridium tetanomorphum DSM 665]MBC2397871.1 AAA domain-containing protein [Clostridium tetanomorphum]MBP1864814.1 magnesium chelatase subunit I [Clostridium tetanomorphum]NRS83990.1 magnesium chelatase subunit I [Clostridium tetanomorphum]NRZ97208.1 magnesium chelatase subunit I [Clostridium tetanomorphum]